MTIRFLILIAFAAIGSCLSATAQAQYRGLQVQVGNYGTGVQVGGMGYGNGLYNRYGMGYGYRGYRNGVGYGRPSTVYLNGGNYGGYGYYANPVMSDGYGTQRFYPTPVRRYLQRRYR